MRAQEWDDIKRLFELALKRPAAERPQLLDEACDGKPAIRQTLDELLKAHDEASGFLEDQRFLGEAEPVFARGQIVADRFRIIRFISRGGMGEVYEAYDDRLGAKIALKTLRSEFARNQEALERFRREIRITRDFGHPNLCRIYELVEHRLLPDQTGASAVVTCLTMQLMDGETLEQYLLREGPLAPEKALPLIRQIADAIDVLHGNGIVHRDLKPSNIMIMPDREGTPRAIVMDFGLAKPFEGDADLFESRSDFQAGAPYYLAPELLRGEKPSAASDIYALGLTIDEMVTSSRPYVADSIEGLLYQKLWANPVPPVERMPGLPLSWSHAILRCLNREPGKRFVSARDVVAQLGYGNEKSTQVEPFFARMRQALTRIPGAYARRARGLRWQTALLVAVAALIAAGTALSFVPATPLKTSVIVFPFENWTGNKDYDYFCKGTTSEIIRRLLDVPGVRVTPFYEPRSDVPSFHPRQRFSIEGHLQISKNIRWLSVDVVENAKSEEVWSRNFKPAVEDPLEIQTEIASNVVDNIHDTLLSSGSNSDVSTPLQLIPASFRKWLMPASDRPGPPPTASSAAMEAYMRGRVLWDEGSLDTANEAVKQYETALREDKNFALAFADLSGVQLTLSEYNVASRPALLQAALHNAEEAVKKGPGLPEAHTALAAVNQWTWKPHAAEQEFRSAIRTNPRFARAHDWFAGFLIQYGRFGPGLAEARTAIDLDPYDYPAHATFGFYLAQAGEPQQAASYLEKFLSERDSLWAHSNLANVYAQLALPAKGQNRKTLLDKALRETDLVAAHERGSLKAGEPGLATPAYALVYALRGDQAQARSYLRVLLSAAPSGAASAEDIADVYVALHDQQRALDVLQRAADQKSSDLLYVKVDPFLQPLHGRKEFEAVLASLGF